MLTTYFLNLLVGNVFHAVDKPAELPEKYYFGLSKTEPSVDGTGVTEPLAENNYARKPIPNFKMSDIDGYVENSVSFVTNEATNGGWGYVPYVCIFDELTDGNLLVYGTYDNPKTMETETIGTIEAGAIRLSVLNE